MILSLETRHRPDAIRGDYFTHSTKRNESTGFQNIFAICLLTNKFSRSAFGIRLVEQ